MDRGVAIFVFLLASMWSQTTLAETESFVVDWTKENNGSWFPIGTIFYYGDSVGTSDYLYSLLDYTYIHIPTVNAITPI